jgi:uncharacterized protein YjbI with pentapeptide repeats
MLNGAILTGVDLDAAVLDGADVAGATGIEAPLLALAERCGVQIGGIHSTLCRSRATPPAPPTSYVCAEV